MVTRGHTPRWAAVSAVAGILLAVIVRALSPGDLLPVIWPALLLLGVAATLFTAIVLAVDTIRARRAQRGGRS